MKYILDTDIISYLFKGDIDVKKKILATSPELLCTTIINYSELMFGISRLGNKSPKLTYYITELFKTLEIVEYDKGSALIFAKLKSDLLHEGKVIMDFDLMIASIAISNNYTLVTNNERHFQRIPKLKIVNWSDRKIK